MENIKHRILVVDDEGIIAMDLQLKLRNMGYDVPAIAHSAQQAIEKVAELNPDLVLMDINMGEGMDGIEAAAHIREQFGGPVVFLTAYADNETLQRAKLTGPCGYIIKPFTESELRVAVEIAIHTSQSAAVLRRHAREQSTIAAFSQRALREMQIELLMEDAVTRIAQTLDVEYCHVLELLPGDKTLLLRAGVGWREGLVGQATIESDPAFPTGSTLATAQSIVFEDLPTEIRFKSSPLLHEHGIISGISVVIHGSEKPFGVLGAYSATQRIFTPDEVNFLEAMGNVISQAIQRRRAEEGLRQARDDIAARQRAEQERTELLRREQEARREAESANRAKDEFLATLSHELRTPLTVMMGWTELLSSGMLDEPTTQEALKTLSRSTRVQVQLVEDILDVSRIVAGNFQVEMQPVALAPLIDAALAAVQPAADAKNIHLEYDGSAAPFMVSGEERRLQQIVWNLLSNAIKFTPEGGRVDVHLKQEGDHVEIKVSDNGQGISPEFLPNVFDRFRQADSSSTRQHGGLGLGLAIVRYLVECHGGTVAVASEGQGKGATFTARLPLLLSDPANPERERRAYA